MEELILKINERISPELIHMTISNPKTKDGIKKVIIRPVQLKKGICYQQSSYEEKKVYHANLSEAECKEKIRELLSFFKQIELVTQSERLTALISKKGKATVKIKKEICERK